MKSILVLQFFVLLIGTGTSYSQNDTAFELSPTAVASINQLLSLFDQGSVFLKTLNDSAAEHEFRQFIDISTKYFENFVASNDIFELLNLNLSETCKQKTANFINALKFGEEWALKSNILVHIINFYSF